MTRWEAELLLYRFEHGEDDETLSAVADHMPQIERLEEPDIPASDKASA